MPAVDFDPLSAKMAVIAFQPDPTCTRANQPPAPSPGYNHNTPEPSRARTSDRASPLKSPGLRMLVIPFHPDPTCTR
ncbi:hypothetical protein, partial [Cryobacterium cheniae]|uniref:hypothetical protein n=1 Tax=Cryobacterium cheniae TaxID=1259262 RepID=UPI001A7E04E2